MNRKIPALLRNLPRHHPEGESLTLPPRTLQEELRFVGATPAVLRRVQNAVDHLFVVTELAAKKIDSLEAENKWLRKWCESNGIPAPRTIAKPAQKKA